MLLLQMGKYKESIEYSEGNLIPYYSNFSLRARQNGCTGLVLSQYLTLEFTSQVMLVFIHHNFQQIDLGLKAVEKAKSYALKSIKAGELNPEDREYKLCKK